MFRTIITSIFLFFVFTGCSQQFGSSKQSMADFRYSIKLPEYEVNHCVEEILEIIASSDSNALRFPPDAYFSKMVFSDFSSYRQIVITPSRWQKILPKIVRV